MRDYERINGASVLISVLNSGDSDISFDRMPEEVSSFRATVIMAVYNHQQWVGLQLESLFRQWRPDIDLLVIDDGSSDQSLKAIEDTLAMHPNVQGTVVRNDQALRAGVLKQFLDYTATPIFIQADSDDLSLPGRIEAILQRFDADQRCRLVTSNAIKISAEGATIGLNDVVCEDGLFADPVTVASRLVDIRWTGATAAFHRSLIADFPLDADLSAYALDLLLPLRATLTGTHHYIAEPLVQWRQHSRNTHRTAYGADQDDAAIEMRQSAELILLAQRIQDIDRARALHADPTVLAEVAAQAEKIFFSHFRAWSRFRTRLSASMAKGARGEVTRAGSPPVVTLRPGNVQTFGVEGRLGRVAAAWDGFHPPEAFWNWTNRRALMSFRSPKTTALRLGIASAWEQSVRLRINEGRWVEVMVTPSECAVTLRLDRSRSGNLLTLMLEAQQAYAPADLVAGNPDTRQLGIQLFWIEAIEPACDDDEVEELALGTD